MSHAAADFFVNQGIFASQHAVDVSGYQCEFDPAYYDDVLFSQHQIESVPSLAHACMKRKAEFFAGRYAACQALKRLNVASTTVGIGEHRNPIWPDGLVGSITHTATQAICAVAKKTAYQNIGIDLANQLSSSTANKIQERIIQVSEADALSKLPLLFEQALTLTFSAKESLFKALYPEVGAYFEFHAAEISEINIENQTFCLRLARMLTPSLAKGVAFRGKFMMQAETVFTSIFIACR